MKKVKLLEERIKKDGKALGKTVLKVDSFINHQVDSEFMGCSGKRFSQSISKTAESQKCLQSKVQELPLH